MTSQLCTPAIGDQFGPWRITRSGLLNTEKDYLLPADQLWDGPMSGQHYTNAWEFHLSRKRWCAPGTLAYRELFKALRAARSVHSRYAPDPVQEGVQ